MPSCIYSFCHGVIPTSYLIFILVSLILYLGLALTVARGEMILYIYPYDVRRFKGYDIDPQGDPDIEQTKYAQSYVNIFQQYN